MQRFSEGRRPTHVKADVRQVQWPLMLMEFDNQRRCRCLDSIILWQDVGRRIEIVPRGSRPGVVDYILERESRSLVFSCEAFKIQKFSGNLRHSYERTDVRQVQQPLMLLDFDGQQCLCLDSITFVAGCWEENRDCARRLENRICQLHKVRCIKARKQGLAVFSVVGGGSRTRPPRSGSPSFWAFF